MNRDENEVEVRHVPERRQFEARLQGELAYLSYSVNGDEVSLDHTFVPDAFRGRGVAADLVRAAVDEARQQHWKLRPRCSYAVTFFEGHPEFADVLQAPRS
ncbi:MAG: GNAT family N-acetyltransferase [Limisphaerales bacterium]